MTGIVTITVLGRTTCSDRHCDYNWDGQLVVTGIVTITVLGRTTCSDRHCDYNCAGTDNL